MDRWPMNPLLLQIPGIPGGPEIFIIVLMILIPIAFLFVLYKVVQAAVRSTK